MNIKAFVVIVCASACLGCGGSKEKSTKSETQTPGPGLTVNDSDGKTGTFSVDGVNYKGNSSTQYFGDKESAPFSVLCQQDEPFALLQAIFSKEADAKGALKPTASSYKVSTGEVNVALSGTAIGAKEFVSRSNSGGSITVTGHKVLIKDLELFDQDDKKKVITAEINF